MPVRVSIRGLEADGAWSAIRWSWPSGSGKGLGEALLRAWDRQSGVALGARAVRRHAFSARQDALGQASDAAVRRQAAQPTRAAASDVADGGQPTGVGGHAAVRSGRGSCTADCASKSKSSAASIATWIGCGSAWRRDSIWPFVATRHISTGSSPSRRTCAIRSRCCKRDEEPHGYAVYRHLREPQGRVTQIVDFLVDPGRRARA